MPELDLSPIYIADYDPENKCKIDCKLPGADVQPSRTFAILDGRQRCTAVALAFGGLRPTYIKNRYSGRYYLDVKTADEAKRVKFVREADVRRKQYAVGLRAGRALAAKSSSGSRR